MNILFQGKNVAPALTLHGRTNPTKQELTPAPGDYNPEKAEKIISDNSPKFSFGIRAQIDRVSTTPGKR